MQNDGSGLTDKQFKMQRLFTIVALITFVITFLNVAFGSLVRSTDSGLACPDWPFCQGQVIPEYKSYDKYQNTDAEVQAEHLEDQIEKQAANKDVIGKRTKDQSKHEQDQFTAAQVYFEFLHRAVAPLISIGLLLMTILCFWKKECRVLLKPVLLADFFLVTQALLGAFTVWELLAPWAVFSHLVNGMLLLVFVFYLFWQSSVFFRKAWQGRPAGNLFASLFPETGEVLSRKTFARILFGFIVFQICIGAIVSSTYTGLACPAFPTCYESGEWFGGGPGTPIHMTHRVTALIITFLLLYSFLYYKEFRSLGHKITVRKLQVALIIQMLLGIFNVIYKLPHAVTVGHTFMAAVLIIVSFANVIIENED